MRESEESENMDIDPDKSNTQILIEMVETVEEVFTSAIAEINKKLDLILGMSASEGDSLRDRYRPTEEESRLIENNERILDEADPAIAERLKAGTIDFAAATDEVTSIIIETLESTWGGSEECTATSSPSTTPRHIMVEWACGESCANFTIFKSGKANTGGKDSDLRQSIRDILESQGFDVRC